MDIETSSTPARWDSPWRLGARSETGFVRSANEDRMDWLPVAIGDVYVISDGMGGYRGGALAAQLTVDTIKQSLARLSATGETTADAVRCAFSAANEAVYQRRDPADPDTQNMGATAVLLITSGSRFLVAHVGDSRAYLWRRGSGLECLTKDHTHMQMMIDRELLVPEDASQHPDSSVLSRAIGHSATVEVDIADWRRIKSGEMLLLCSDGLSGYLTDPEIDALLSSGGGPRQIADALIDSALQKGGEDNVTVQLLRYAPRRRWPRSLIVASVAALGIALAMLIGWRLPHSISRQDQIELSALRAQFDAIRSRFDQQAVLLAVAGKDIQDLRTQLAAIQTASTPAPAIAPFVAKEPESSSGSHRVNPKTTHAAPANIAVHPASPKIKKPASSAPAPAEIPGPAVSPVVPESPAPAKPDESPESRS